MAEGFIDHVCTRTLSLWSTDLMTDDLCSGPQYPMSKRGLFWTLLVSLEILQRLHERIVYFYGPALGWSGFYPPIDPIRGRRMFQPI